MNRLNELIKELCPNGVAFKTINEITKWDKKFNNINNYYYKCFKHVSAATLKELKNDSGTIKLLSTGNFDGVALKEDAIDYINNDEVFTIPSGGSANIKYYNGEFVDSGNIIGTSIDNNFYNTKYIYYVLENNNKLIQSYFRGSGVKHPDMSAILKIRVAVPPLEVQDEIVRILDDFTLLSAELSAELKARKDQYQYYIDYFFTLENKEDLKEKVYQLDELGELLRGKRFVHADAVSENGIPAIHYGELYTFYGVTATETKSQIRKDIPKKLRYAKKGDVVIVGAGENNIDIGIGVAWLGDYEVAVHDACYTFHPSKKILPQYLSFYLRSNMYHQQIKKYVSEGKICAISAQGIGKSKIYVPSKEEQKRVINILEKFDKLSTDISEGLPAEIEARQKQYEYYRDKLLTFKELVNEG